LGAALGDRLLLVDLNLQVVAALFRQIVSELGLDYQGAGLVNGDAHRGVLLCDLGVPVLSGLRKVIREATRVHNLLQQELLDPV